MNTYEGMFVIDTKEVRKGPEEATEKIRGLVTKVGGELAEIMRWDERKLAYEINGRDSGLYMLTYFRGGPDVVKDLNRECRLSSFVLRLLPLRVKEIPDLDTVTTPQRAAREREEREKAKRAEQEAERSGSGPADKKPADAPADKKPADAPAADAPAAAAPAEDAPAADAPAADTPAAAAPAAEPVAAEPVAAEPVAAEPVATESPAGEAAPEPAVDEVEKKTEPEA